MKAGVVKTRSGSIIARDSKGRRLKFVTATQLQKLVGDNAWLCDVCALRGPQGCCTEIGRNMCTRTHRAETGTYVHPQAWAEAKAMMKAAGFAKARAEAAYTGAEAATIRLLKVR